MQPFKIRVCDCGKAVTGHKLHCSSKCRSRVNMRRMRERNKIEQAVQEALSGYAEELPKV